jgi:hypothetical protein
MICSPAKILAFQEELVKLNDQIRELEQTINKCNEKQLDSSIFQNEMSIKQYWKKHALDVIDVETKKCELFKILQQ